MQVHPVDGEPDAFCDISLSACEDGTIVSATCDNDTFSGLYECTWTSISGVRLRSGRFESEDICRLSEEDAVREISDNTPLDITIAP